MTQQYNDDGFSIERIYIKELSFEAPQSPEIFTDSKWRPELELQLSTKSKQLEDDIHEVVLSVTSTAIQSSETVFSISVQQAGVFIVETEDEQEIHRILGSKCPAVLFPYARELIASLVQKAGFPSLHLEPVDFEAIYHDEILKDESKIKREALH